MNLLVYYTKKEIWHIAFHIHQFFLDNKFYLIAFPLNSISPISPVSEIFTV